MSAFFDRLRATLLFDGKDRQLLAIVHDVLGREDASGFKHLLTPYLHPRGVTETAAAQGLRIAYAAANLLAAPESGNARGRIEALRSLRDEVMNASVTYLRRNTARTLVQIMKELVRSHGDQVRQLELAHDFNATLSGKARIVDRELTRYHLLRMPEDWSQIAFDNHVHDVNTKGRKSATHLIMDAWIKGIKHLTVIYYNYIPPEAAEELLESAAIMHISVRLGVEFRTRCAGKAVRLIWVPRGFSGSHAFLDFLRQPKVAAFMEAGRNVSMAQAGLVFGVLDRFNRTGLPDINRRFQMDAPALDPWDFIRAVGMGQPSLLHLRRYLHGVLMPHLEARYRQLGQSLGQTKPEERPAIEARMAEIDALDPYALGEKWLDPLMVEERRERGCPHGEACLPGASAACASDPAAPPDAKPVREDCLRQYFTRGPLPAEPAPAEIIDQVESICSGNRFILNLRGLDADDVLEILYESRGRVTHLELVNLKNTTEGKLEDIKRIIDLYEVVNAESLIPLKRWVLNRLDALARAPGTQDARRRRVFSALLESVAGFHEIYRVRPLRPSLGSDSTGQSGRLHGMGLAVRDTLPVVALRQAGKPRGLAGRIPLGVRVLPRFVFEPRESAHPLLRGLYSFARRHLALAPLGYKARREYTLLDFRPSKNRPTNLMLLGGIRTGDGNRFGRVEPRRDTPASFRLRYLNRNVRNALKILIGFVPAMLSFLFSKDWWVLKYFGSVIWFAITGLRNVVQSVLGGGGFSRTPLIKWNDYVSWSRLSDSLLYTGFSVPLLDVLVKTVLLDKGVGVTSTSNPLLFFAVMALANGAYISTHNLVRGLPRMAAGLNFFRSVLSIPLAMAISAALCWLVGLSDPAGAAAAAQQWAAVVSKLASDVVAAVIEGLADRGNNLEERLGDYKAKFERMLAVQERLEALYPQVDVLGMLANPKDFMKNLGQEHKELENAVIVNALDCLYFWMYQPRGRTALSRLLRDMNPAERQSFRLSQNVLRRKREISQLFLDGLVGKNFSRGLAFYLDHGDTYLAAVDRMVAALGDTPGTGALERHSLKTP
ncbi:hypothetical protein JCM15519_11390 [Fundidesulfovibrio butyratiphilus]